MFGRFPRASGGPEDGGVEPQASGWGRVSSGYDKPVGLARLQGVFIGLFVLLVSGLILLGAAQWVPGVPAKWRPFERLSLWQAERFYAQALLAEKAGDWEMARVAHTAALEVRPDAPAPRWRLGRRLSLEGKFSEAAAMLAPVTSDPTVFIHDSLLEAGDYEGLARFALAGLEQDRGRRGVWIGVLRVAFARCSRSQFVAIEAEVAKAISEVPPEESAWLKAIMAEAKSDTDGMVVALREREAGGVLAAADVLLGLELWIGVDRVSDGWVWVQRHRAALGLFDGWFADWRIALIGEPREAARLLEELRPDALDASRWHRLAAVVLLSRRVEMIGPLEKLAAQKTPPVSACVAVWAVTMALKEQDAAGEWAVRVSRGGGPELPMLLGRALAGDDAEARWRAALLLAVQSGMPREILSAIALSRGS